MTDPLKPLTSAELADLKAKAKAAPIYSTATEWVELYDEILCLIAMIERRDEQIEKLRTALSAVVADVREYERINHLCPNPGHEDCWQSVTNASEALAATEPQK